MEADDGDGDGDISSSGERGRRGTRRRREEGGAESAPGINVLAPPSSPETTIKR